MKKKAKFDSINIPALRAYMGDWVYYICLLKMSDIAQRISIAEDIHSSKSLRDLLQRRLTARSTDITKYLLSQPQRFFNALVVGTYGGNPQWNELSINTERFRIELPESIEGALGILTLEGSEKLFAIDGQHRVAGIRGAIKGNTIIKDEEVCVILVSGISRGERSKDPNGFERTRRLFSTLNRYAKPVGKRDIIALDEDDAIAIITRKLVEEYPFFQEKVSIGGTKSISPTDRKSFTSIIVLYDAIDHFLRDRIRGWNDFKKFRPPDEQIDELYEKIVSFWDIFISSFKPLKIIENSDPSDQLARQFRHGEGGHLLFRPIGLLLCVRTIKLFINNDVTLKEAVRRLTKVPMEISENPWKGLLWDDTNNRMITSTDNQKAALKLLYYSLGGNLIHLKSKKSELIKEMSGLLNKEESEIRLPRYYIKRRRKILRRKS